MTFQALYYVHIYFFLQRISNQSVEIKKNKRQGIMPSEIICPQNTNPQQTIGPGIRQHQLMTVYSSRDSQNISRRFLLSQNLFHIVIQQFLSELPEVCGYWAIQSDAWPRIVRENIQRTINRSDKKPIRQDGTAQLKQIVKQQKIKQLVKNYIKKSTMNNTYLNPVEYTPFVKPTQVKFWDYQGIQINNYLILLTSMLSTFIIVALIIIYTLSIVFKQIDQSLLFKVFQPITLVFYLTQLALNLVKEQLIFWGKNRYKGKFVISTFLKQFIHDLE